MVSDYDKSGTHLGCTTPTQADRSCPDKCFLRCPFVLQAAGIGSNSFTPFLFFCTGIDSWVRSPNLKVIPKWTSGFWSLHRFPQAPGIVAEACSAQQREASGFMGGSIFPFGQMPSFAICDIVSIYQIVLLCGWAMFYGTQSLPRRWPLGSPGQHLLGEYGFARTVFNISCRLSVALNLDPFFKLAWSYGRFL